MKNLIGAIICSTLIVLMSNGLLLAMAFGIELPFWTGIIFLMVGVFCLIMVAMFGYFWLKEI